MKQKKDRIKVAILDHCPDLGGAEVALLTFLKYIDRTRFEVTVIVPSEGSFSKALKQIEIPVAIISLPGEVIRLKRGNAFRSVLLLFFFFFSLQGFMWRLCRVIKKNHTQLILTNTIKAHLYGSLAARLCSLPLLWRFHDLLDSPDFSPWLIRWIVLFGGLFPRRILAVSRTVQDHLIRNGVKSRKTEVIFNAVDHERFEVKKRSQSIREELGLPGGARLVGCIGRIIPQKGLKVLVSAIPGVLQRYPETFFLVIGDVFLNEEAYQKELLDTVKKNGIEEKVKFTGFRADIGAIMDSLDIVVFPSIAPEAFGLSILEAQSLGKPVIASNIGGVREMIEDRVSGFLVDPDRPEQITERILYLFADPEIRERIGQNGKDGVRQKFSLRNYVLQLEQACRESALKGGQD